MTSSSSSSSSSKAKEYILAAEKERERGKNFFSKKQYKDALIAFKQGINCIEKAYPSPIDYNKCSKDELELLQILYLNSGKCQWQQGAQLQEGERGIVVADAETYFKRAKHLISHGAIHWKARHALAQIYESQKNYSAALEEAQMIVKHKQDADEETFKKAFILYKNIINTQKAQNGSAKSSSSSSNNTNRKSESSGSEGDEDQEESIPIGKQKETLKQLRQTQSTNNYTLWLIDYKWWVKWNALEDNLCMSDGKVLEMSAIKNWSLIESKYIKPLQERDYATLDRLNNQPGVIDMRMIQFASTYLSTEIVENRDYIVLTTAQIHTLKEYGYNIEPLIFVRQIERYDPTTQQLVRTIDMYPYLWDVCYINEQGQVQECKVRSLLSETVVNIKRRLASKFICQSSSIRLRSNDPNGLIWEDTMTLLDLKADDVKYIFVESRLPNGCWMTSSSLKSLLFAAKRSQNNTGNKKIGDDTDKTQKTQQDEVMDDNKSSEIMDKDEKSIVQTKTLPEKECAACRRLISQWEVCECKLYYFCNVVHKAAFSKHHQNLCSKLAQHYTNKKDIPIDYQPRSGKVGLRNLGNTCYMNAALQCLSFLPEFVGYFVSDEYMKDINPNNPLGYKGQLAAHLDQFFKQCWFGYQRSVIPVDLKRFFGKVDERWAEPEQHDAEEFIGWLLDGINEDLNRAKEKPYYELRDSDGREDMDVASEHWQLHLKRNQSQVMDLFGGQQKSTLTCSECEYTSIRFDPFTVLQLPVPDKESQMKVKCIVFPKDRKEGPFSYILDVTKRAVVSQVTRLVAEKSEIASRNLLLCRVEENRFVKYFSLSRPMSNILKKNPPVYIYEIEYTTAKERKRKGVIQIRMNFRARSQADKYIYFAHPFVFEMNGPVTGQQLFEKVRQFISLLKKKNLENDNSIAPYPSVELSVRVDQDDVPIGDDNEEIPLTDESKNTCTVHVNFTVNDVMAYIDREKAVRIVSNDDERNQKMEKEVNVYDCLKLFTAPEVLETPWKCKVCNKTTEASKQLDLWRLPEVLIIHLKRFVGGVVGYFGGYGRKLQGLIKFPIRDLDLTPYLPSEQRSNGEIPKYDLFAVINHWGVMEGGHNWAFVRGDKFAQCPNMGEFITDSAKNEEWFSLDDEKVSPLDRTDVITSYAYVLFYRRRREPNQ